MRSLLVAACLLVFLAQPGLPAPATSSAGDAYEAARGYFERGEFDRAADILEGALPDDPGDARLHYLLGKVYRDILPRRLDDAAAQLTEALHLDPHLPEAAAALAEVWMRAGQLIEAERFLRRRVEDFPGESTALWQLGALLQADGRYEEGHQLLQRAIVADPMDPRIWLEVGRGKLRSGEPERAVVPLERARDLDPASPAASYNLSQAYLATGRAAEGEAEMEAFREKTAAREQRERDSGDRSRRHRSIRILEERLATDPERPIQETIGLAALYRETGSIEAGRAFFEGLASSRPERAAPVIGLALLERRSGDAAATWELLRRARDREPQSAAVLGVMTDFAASRAQQQELESHLRALQELPDAPDEVPLWLGILAARQGKLEVAEMALERMLEHTPDHPAALLRLASLYDRTDRDILALETYQRLVRTDPENGLAWFRMAQIEDRMGKREEAMEHLGRALAAGEQRPQVLNLLGRLNLQAGEADKALALFERSLVTDPDQPEIEAVVEELRAGAVRP